MCDIKLVLRARSHDEQTCVQSLHALREKLVSCSHDPIIAAFIVSSRSKHAHVITIFPRETSTKHMLLVFVISADCQFWEVEKWRLWLLCQFCRKHSKVVNSSLVPGLNSWTIIVLPIAVSKHYISFRDCVVTAGGSYLYIYLLVKHWVHCGSKCSRLWIDRAGSLSSSTSSAFPVS